MSIDKLLEKGEDAVNMTMKSVSQQRLGVLDASFLSQSVGLLHVPLAVCMAENDSVEKAIGLLRKYHIGCVLIVDQQGKLSGMFSERDCMERVICSDLDRNEIKVKDYMTREPVTIDFTVSLAYALSLMSIGGFRHLPIVDDDKTPVGVVSVKDIVNCIAETFVEDLLGFGKTAHA